MNIQSETVVSPSVVEQATTIFAGSYINKLSGEQIEHECRRKLDAGCKELNLDFSQTEIVNSIGISILLGVIDVAEKNGAKVVFSEVGEDTVELFEMLGLTKHVTIQ